MVFATIIAVHKGVPIMSIAASKLVDSAVNSASRLLSSAEIDTLLDRLARGHLSTFQEDYTDLKQALRPVNQA
jgi:hypothetical protein